MNWRDRAKELFDEGMSLTDIASEVGVARSTVTRILRRMGCNVNRRATVLKSTMSTVRKLFDEDVSIFEISHRLGITEVSVRRYLTEATKGDSDIEVAKKIALRMHKKGMDIHEITYNVPNYSSDQVAEWIGA